MFVDHGLYLETKRNIFVDQGLSVKNWETADVCQYWHGIMQWLMRECLLYLLGRRGSSLLSWLLVMFDNSRGGLNWGAEGSGETQVLVNVHEPSRSLCAMLKMTGNTQTIDRLHSDPWRLVQPLQQCLLAEPQQQGCLVCSMQNSQS